MAPHEDVWGLAQCAVAETRKRTVAMVGSGALRMV